MGGEAGSKLGRRVAACCGEYVEACFYEAAAGEEGEASMRGVGCCGYSNCIGMVLCL